MSALLEVKGLCKSYKTFALDNVDLSVPAGSVVGFIGENGAGKTTTLKSILNICRRDGGSVSFFGKPLEGNEKEIKNRLGVVFEDCAFPEVMKASQVNGMMRRIFQNWDEKYFSRMLEQMKLSDKMPVKEYSRGMKMKLSLAVALSHKPDLLLLDEATSGLDPVMREECLDLFMEFLQNPSHGILMSTHITSDLDKIADRIVFLHEGRVTLDMERDVLLETYGLLRCTREELDRLDQNDALRFRQGAFGCEVLLKNREAYLENHPQAVVERPTIEEIMLFYVRGQALCKD